LKASVSTYSYASSTRTYAPAYYALESYDEISGKYTLFNTNPGTTSYLGDVVGSRDGNTHYYFEGRFNWGDKFGDHNVGFMTVGIGEEKILTSGRNGSIKETLPERNLGNSSRLTYDYDSRYFLEASYGWNGSEKFDSQHRFGFFPALALGWIVSNEPFYSDALRNVLSLVKLKYSWGKVGNDAIGERSDRFLYLSDIATGGSPYYWGNDFLTTYSGYTIRQYENQSVAWEISTKQNVGIELELLKGMNIQLDFFHDVRDNIYWPRNNLPKSLGFGNVPIRGNIGQVNSEGLDGSIDYKHSFSRNLWITARANYTFTRNKIVKIDEAMNKPEYRFQVGHPVNQQWGYVAERLFLDQAEIDNSPEQNIFGTYMRGDIKYTDVNDDGVINQNDQIPIGYPTVPQIQYGYGISAGYKKMDFSFFFQGNAQVSFFINPSSISPLINRRNAPAIIANDAWSEMHPDVHAFWPRLSVEPINNNYANSTWWLRDGSFMRLKTVELGYSTDRIKRLRISNVRVYISGENLFYLSAFKLWDPEMGGNGLAYPINRRFNLGLQLSF
jgi:TonB-linked SusC/RagA family outer membrane protein